MGVVKKAAILMVAGGMLTPALPAQSVWQKMKQSWKESQQQAKAQQQAHQAQQTRASGTATSNAQPQAASVASPVDVSSPAIKALFRKLDVHGVQLGMTPKAAQAAIQSRNRVLVEDQVQPFVFADLPKTEFTGRTVYRAAQPYEVVMLGLTLQPMQPEVLAISRETRYEIDHQPTGGNTVAALRAKYGPESILEDTPSASEIFMLWFFDGEGNLVPKARAEKIRSCGVNFREPGAVYIVRDALPPHWDTNCVPYTFLKAILYTNPPNTYNNSGQSLPPGLVRAMEVTTESFPLFTKTVNATRQMVMAANAANLRKNKEAADKNVAPL